MDCVDYMDQGHGAQRGTGYVSDDERALPKRRRRQRDVWQTKTTQGSKGEPYMDLYRTMGYGSTQSKVTGESLEEAVLRGCGYDTDAKVKALEGKGGS